MPSPAAVTEVTIHPIVLLSVVDHFNRVAKVAGKKSLTGYQQTSSRSASGNFFSRSRRCLEFICRFDYSHLSAILIPVPFEEDSDVWFLDHNYHEELALMFRKVNGCFSSDDSNGKSCWLVQHRPQDSPE